VDNRWCEDSALCSHLNCILLNCTYLPAIGVEKK
jgi:hypothetical protein